MHTQQLEALKQLAMKYSAPLSKVKEFILPSVGKHFALDGLVYKVTYINSDKCRFTAEFQAVATPAKSKKKEGFLSWLTKKKKEKKSVPTSG